MKKINTIKLEDGGLFFEPGTEFKKAVKDLAAKQDARRKEQETLAKQGEGKKVIASLKPNYNNAMNTDTTGPYGRGYTQEEQRYFESKGIPTDLWASEKKRLEDEAIVQRRKDVQQQAIKDVNKGDFTKARAENLTNAFRMFPNDPNSFIDEWVNPAQMIGYMAGNLGRHFASDAGPLDLKALALDVAAPLAVGAIGGLGAKSTGQFVNNIANPLAGTGKYLTTKTPLKNAYKLNPLAAKEKDVDMLWRWEADQTPVSLLEKNAVPSEYTGRWFQKGEPGEIIDYLKTRPGPGTLKGLALPKGVATLPSDAAKFTGSESLKNIERIVPSDALKNTTNFRLENNPFSEINNPNFIEDFKNLKPLFDNAKITPNWLDGYATKKLTIGNTVNNLGDKYLPNAYKFNPFAIKTPQEVILHRVQKPGQTAEYLMGQHYASKPLESLSLEQKIKAMKSNQPGIARGFSSDINDLAYYSNPNIMEARGYTGNPEILRMRVPAKQLPEFSIENYNKTRGVGDKYNSLKPNEEFILPIDRIQNAEKFSIDDLAKLREEFNAVNTPHWLRGYKEVPKFEDGGDVTPMFTSDLKDPRIQKYNDSMSLYNAYKFQKDTQLKNLKASLDKSRSDFTSQSDFNFWKNAHLAGFGNIQHSNNKSAWRTEFQRAPSIREDYFPEEKPIVDYFNKIAKGNKNFRVSQHRSPDLWHKSINPIGEYYDDIGYSPVYKKPVQPIVYKPEEEIPMFTLPEITVSATNKVEPQTTTPQNMSLPPKWYSYQGPEKGILVDNKYMSTEEFDKYVQQNPNFRYAAQPNSVGYVYRPGQGIVRYEDGGTFDFVRNQSLNPTTNFEKRFYNTYNKMQNPDRSFSSHEMMSWSDDQGYYAAPTIVEQNGKLKKLDPNEAMDYAYKTNEYKKFNSPEEAEAYANNGYKANTPLEVFAPNKEFEPNALYGGRNNQSVDTTLSPELWEKRIRDVESKIGNPSTWTMDSYNQLQNTLNDYKNWRENTKEGKAVYDSHNEPNEYVVPLPDHLKTYANGGVIETENGGMTFLENGGLFFNFDKNNINI